MTAKELFFNAGEEQNSSYVMENYLKVGTDALLEVGVILSQQLRGENANAHMENVWENLAYNYFIRPKDIEVLLDDIRWATAEYIKYVKTFRPAY